MRKSSLVGGLAAAVASMLLVLPPPATAAPTGSTFSDLYIIQRTVNGVPMPSGPFQEVGGLVTCVSPIAVIDGAYADIPGIPSTPNPVDGRLVDLVPLRGNTVTTPALDDTACLPQVGFEQYVAEVELERLNLARTSDEVLNKKIAEVALKLDAATDISLDGAGRITVDGVAIDASPDHVAIYRSLMNTGTIPGLNETIPGIEKDPPNLFIQQGANPADGFDEWMLAAAAIGTAGGKSVPVNPDTIEYYGRIAAPTAGVDAWGYIPVLPETFGTPPERFIDYAGITPYSGIVDPPAFSYTRANVYKGCTTWLDVETLKWEYGTVLSRIQTDVWPDIVDLSGGTATNVVGFTQLADDVRAVINYLHENEVVVNPDTGYGFYIDPVFQNTCTTPNPALAPEGIPLSQAQMVAYLNDLVIGAEPPSVTITDAPAVTTTATDATFAFDTSADTTRVLCVLDGGPIEDCLSPKTYTGLAPGEHTFTVIAMGLGGIFASDVHTWTILPPGEDSMITPLTPVRFADTRPGWVAADGLFYGTGPVPAGGVVQVQIAGRGAVPVGAKAVVANVTLVNAAAAGFATVFPCGTVPDASSVNYLALTNEAVANEVIAKLSPTGSICVFTSAQANVLVDVAGYVPATSDFVSLTPVRLADTRPTPVGAGAVLEVPISGRAGVPADAKAVVANVTLVNAAAPGFATVFPCGTVPDASSVNYLALTNEAVANEVIAKLSPTGSICVFTSAQANVLVDVAGYVPATSDFVSLTPVRLADTRPTPVGAGAVLEVPISGRAGVPADAKAVVANVTLVNAAAPGFATVFPCGTVPDASTANYRGATNEAVANEVIAKLSPTGSICVYTYAAANVLVDVVGHL